MKILLPAQNTPEFSYKIHYSYKLVKYTNCLYLFNYFLFKYQGFSNYGAISSPYLEKKLGLNEKMRVEQVKAPFEKKSPVEKP